MELKEAGTDVGKINAGETCTRCRDSNLADSFPLFPGNQDMQVVRVVVLRDGTFSLCVFGFSFLEVRAVSNSRESVILFHFCSVLKKIYISSDNRISFSSFLFMLEKVFFQALHFINILNRFVWCSLAAPARVTMF